MDYVVYVLMSVFLIVGVYQFYFWTQNHSSKDARSLEIPLDRKFNLKAGWVWVYSGLYYPVIVAIIFTIGDMRTFNYTSMSYFLLLFMQMFFFHFYPVATPAHWRQEIQGDRYSVAMLKLVHHFDKPSNCFPSMHVSVATLTALHLMANAPGLGLWPLLFPVLIGFSALYTKQHYIMDLLPGAILGWVAFLVFNMTYVPLG
ncbi:MAG: phosphatase PAP2 family protein [gamma proteobacterium symbiont of Bathyaustriella thionipta]|nr:phosphatase PAP2 family protein [gamma proteobacterium symbiont of Bathyaustriella thionipta]